jgi:Uma2 family endonuclease/DNA-binding CsgD family transcriptional regulator
MTTSLDITEELLYPSFDGNPMAESTEQYRWIVMVKENLELLFINQPDVFIAADLLWYPIKVNAPPAPRCAPDVMVMFGRPKGSRRSYLQWKENNIPAQVVFEILSASNKTRDGIEGMEAKFDFYETYGVEEYYIYDPDEFTLEGWQRRGSQLIQIAQMSGWVSPLLGITFQWQPRTDLVLYHPNRQPFRSLVEADRQTQQAELRANRSQLQATQAQQQATQAQQRATQAEQSLQEAAPRLLSLGLSVKQVADSLGLSVETVQAIVDSAS